MPQVQKPLVLEVTMRVACDTPDTTPAQLAAVIDGPDGAVAASIGALTGPLEAAGVSIDSLDLSASIVGGATFTPDPAPPAP